MVGWNRYILKQNEIHGAPAIEPIPSHEGTLLRLSGNQAASPHLTRTRNPPGYTGESRGLGTPSGKVSCLKTAILDDFRRFGDYRFTKQGSDDDHREKQDSEK
jgi:hypothetical protein